jgi:hypothetical protein
MKPTPEMIEAAAQADATFDGRGRLNQLSAADRKRYLDRAAFSLPHTLAAMWQPIETRPLSGEEYVVRSPDGSHAIFPGMITPDSTFPSSWQWAPLPQPPEAP